MSRIDLQIVGTANFGQIESALTRLRAQLASINAMQMTGLIPSSAQQSIDGYLKTFRETIDASGMYQRQLVSITNETEKFGRSLERGNLRLGQLYKTAMDYRRTEIGQIRQLAREQVRMQNAVAISRGDGMAEVFVPRGLDEGIEKTRILSQEYRILRQVVRNGSTELINWGKNTQWAGRQLTVGLTVPITMFGAAAAKAFMDADKQLTRLTKVYGDAAKGMVSATDLEQIRSQATGLAQEIASGMGVSVTETLGIAADIAATGKEGTELLSATREAMRLSVLGEVDRQEAMRATLAIQTVFKQSTEGLTDSINFLNAVENQTSTSLNDLVTGIVKAGPVVQGLGGSIEDLALMMVAMREGGVPASEAANAIKSSMGALINPTKQTTQVLNDFGIDLKNIVDSNAGDVIGTLVGLQGALEGLDELSRQRSIEQIFGKFQFSRINALLNNLNKAGSQTEQVLALAGLSTTQLAETAQRELAAVTESVTGRFQRAVESLKANLIPIGETFTEIGTILINVGSKILEVFNSLPDPVKNFFKLLTLGTAVIGPIIMITGVLGNFFGYLVKGISTLMLFKKAGRGAFDLLTPESAATMKATELLTESLFDQTVAVDTMASAIDRLITKLESLQSSMNETVQSSNIVDQRVLANAEAAASGVSPATLYTTPSIPFAKQQRAGRPESETELTWTAGGERNIQYSHLTGLARIEDVLGDKVGNFYLQGMGTWVEAQAAEVQKQLNTAMMPKLFEYSEDIMSPEFRREELLRMAESRRVSAGGDLSTEKYDQLVSKIRGLTDEQLAQILPSWEKIKMQTTEYTSVLSTAAEGLRSKNAETVSKVKDALDDYRKDSISDPDAALIKLRQSLDSAGLSIKDKAEDISSRLEDIRRRALAIEDPQLRAAEFERMIAEEVIDPYELQSFQTMRESGVKGFGTSQGYHRILMATAQSQTDAAMNQVRMSDELRAAHDRAINSKEKLRQAEEKYGQSIVDSMSSQERLDLANNNLASILEKRKLSDDFTRGQSGDWEYKTGKKATGTELIAALDERESALLQASQADIEYVTSLDQLNDARDRNWQSAEMLASAQEKEALSYSNDSSSKKLELANEELKAATEKLELARLRAAQATTKEEARSKALSAASTKFNALAARKTELENQGLARTAEYNQVTDELSATYAMMVQLANEGMANAEEFNLAQEQLQQAMIEEATIREKVANAARENIAATEKDTTETLQAAGAENQQEASAKKNAAGTDKDTVETLQAAGAENIQEQSALRNAAANDEGGGTGGGLFTKGGGKLSMMGAGLGSVLSMATMFMPTGDNETLNAATNILGGAGMGASMGGMAGPWGALAGALIGGAIPAVTEYVSNQNEANAALMQYSEALNGSSIMIDRFAKDMGVLKPSEQLMAAIGNISSPEKVITEGAALLETEAGKQLIDLSKQFSGTELVDALRTQLQQLTLLEIFTPEQAKLVAENLALELGQPMLGQALIDGINSVLDNEGKLITDKVAELFAGTIPEFDFSNIPWPTEEFAGFGQSFEDLNRWASENIGGIASNLDKLREAQALTTKEFMDGKITYEDYANQMTSIRQQTTLAIDTLVRMKNLNVDVSMMLKDVASAGGIADQYVAAENAAKDLMDTLSEGMSPGQSPFGALRERSAFYTSIQISAAYGDITESEVRSILQLAQDPTKKAEITALFNIEGAQENATELIKLMNSGMDTKFILDITTRAQEIGTPLNDLYASLVAISTLPTEIQKRVIADISNSPELLSTFIQNYEYAMSLPNSNKELKAEIFGNDDFELFQDNWEAFVNLPDEERKRAIFEYMVTGSYDFAAPEVQVPAAVTELTSPDVSAMVSSLTSGGGGGGGSGNDELSKALDKKIKQQDQIIKQIQKEREERQKLLDLERKALDFSMRQQDLESQILIAKSEGRIADAALLQSQLDAERIADREDEKERLRQEEEDRRIKKAEREKKRLEKEKQKASESSGSDGGGGSDESEMRRIEQRIKFLNDELNAALLNNTDILDQIAAKGGDAFWKSDAVKKYKDALIELGIPLNVINEQLENVYDELVNKGFGDQGIRQFDKIQEALIKVGISGETLTDVLPSIFGILSNPRITRGQAIKLIAQEFIKAGDNAKVATQRAKDFLRASGQKVRFTAIEEFNDELDKLIGDVLTKNQGEKISKEFAEGMKNGLTNKQILDNIYSTIYEDTLRKSIKDGMSADKAARDAEAMANSVQSTLVSRFDRFSVQINHKATYDQTELPDWLREERDARGGFMTADAMDRLIKHDVSVTGDLKLEQGSTSSNPLYVNVVNSQNGGSGSSGSIPVGTTRTMNGKTYSWNGSRWILVPGAATGGLFRRYGMGSFGAVRGPGGPTDDLIPAMLSNGEYVIRASSVDKYGIQLMDMINTGKLDLMAKGGYSKYPSIVSSMAKGGGVYYNAGGIVSDSAKNIEYNINVNVEGTNSSADEIANKVMSAIERKQSMSRTVNRI